MRAKSENQTESVLLRVEEVAEMLALGRSKVYEMTNAGELPVVRIGTAVRVPKKCLLELIDQRTMKAA